MSFESRFGQAADAYQTFRPDYPEEIFRRILGWIPADKRNCAIDLGAGTGKASRELVKSFREVIAIEPDPLMVEKLREAAPGATITQITAEEYEREQSSADLINSRNRFTGWIFLACLKSASAGFEPAEYWLCMVLVCRKPSSRFARLCGANSASTGAIIVTSGCAASTSRNASSTSK